MCKWKDIHPRFVENILMEIEMIIILKIPVIIYAMLMK